jgi:hypothetical protein
MSAAVVIGIQFWYADRGGLYVLWFAPLLSLLIFRPNLSELKPVPPGPMPGFVTRTATWVRHRGRPPQPATTEIAAVL